MHSSVILSVFLTQILKEKTGLNVYNNTAPITETNPYVCFFIQSGEEVSFINRIQAWDEYDVIIHNWNNGSYDYNTAELIRSLNNIQGYSVENYGYIQSCIFQQVRLLSDDINKSKWYGIYTRFKIRVKSYESNSNETI